MAHLTDQQIKLLRGLADFPEGEKIRPSDLVRHLEYKDRASVTRTYQALVEKGFVGRKQVNARKVLIWITGKGRTYLKNNIDRKPKPKPLEIDGMFIPLPGDKIGDIEPRPLVTREEMARLYAGRRYEDYKGREFMDGRPVFRGRRHSLIGSSLGDDV